MKTEPIVLLLKSNVKGYTRADGTQVKPHFRRGDRVRDAHGNEHEVLDHKGSQVTTYGGQSFHPTKLHHVQGPESGSGRAPFKVGDRVKIKKEYQDAGDDKYEWEVVGAEEKGRVDISPKIPGMNMRPRQTVTVDMIER